MCGRSLIRWLQSLRTIRVGQWGPPRQSPPSPVPADHQPRTNKAAAVTKAVVWNYNLNTCPLGTKVHLLTRWFVSTESDGMKAAKLREQGFIAWAPLPDRDKELEQQLGYLSKFHDAT